MRKLAAVATILLGLLSLAGCERKVSVLSADGKQALIPEKKLTDHDKVQFLREEAKKRGLHWTVWCISWAAPNQPGIQGSASQCSGSSA